MIMYEPRYKLRDLLTNIIKNYAVLIVMFVLIVITGIIKPNFLTLNNSLNILRQVSVVGIAACGMTYVIISGAFDLSVGSVISLSGVIAIVSINSGVPEYLAIIYALLAGLAVGIFNGTLVSLINGRGGEAFIITFGSQIAVAAVALFVSKGLFISGKFTGSFYKSIGRGLTPIIILVFLVFLMEFILIKTSFGRRLKFIGGNMQAAKMSGIMVQLYRISFFAISGLLAGIGGIVLTSRVTSANPTGGTGYELDAIAAVVVGGTSLAGGKGSIVKTLIGAVVLGVLGTALNVLGVTAYPQMMIKGALILIAVGLDVWNKRVKSEKANETVNAK